MSLDAQEILTLSRAYLAALRTTWALLPGYPARSVETAVNGLVEHLCAQAQAAETPPGTPYSGDMIAETGGDG